MQYVQPDGYLAVPPTGKGNAVLDLNAWWGLNDSMKAFCKRLAESGSSPSLQTSIMARSPTT